jgi:purine-nucleoside phosphorylase
MNPVAAQAREAADYVGERCSVRPDVGIVLGSGLSTLSLPTTTVAKFACCSIPHFPRPTVAGHEGSLELATAPGHTLAILHGRIHLYEGYSASEVAFPVRLLSALGCKIVVVTNAAGGLNPAYRPGDLMLIADHIFLPGMAGASPLFGRLDPELGPRFVPLAMAYDWQLRQLAHSAAADAGLPLHDGVYVMVAGPHYETPAELRLLRALGGDAIGMSTCPEVVAARHLDLRVLGISAIANTANGGDDHALSHEQVLAGGAIAEPQLSRLLAALLLRLEP